MTPFALLVLIIVSLAFGTAGALIGRIRHHGLNGFFFGLLLGPLGLLIIGIVTVASKPRREVR